MTNHATTTTSSTSSTSVPVGPAPSTRSVRVDSALVQETRQHIHALTRQVSELAQADIDVYTFCGQLLQAVVPAMAAVGGAVWINQDQQLQLTGQVNLPQQQLQDEDGRRHASLLRDVLAHGRPTVIPPRSGHAAAESGGNPTEFVLVIAAFPIDAQRSGLIEIFQRPGAGPASHRGYLQFVMQMCEQAALFFKQLRLRQLERRALLWRDVEAMLKEIHRSLNVAETADAIANETRRVAQCDRVCLLLSHGRRMQVASVSGAERLDVRSSELVALRHLAQCAQRVELPYVYSDDRHPPDTPPQLVAALEQYRAHSQTRALMIVPLIDSTRKDKQQNPLGMLVLEQVRSDELPAETRERATMIAEHCGAAVAHAVEHSRLFLAPLWKTLGRWRQAFTTSRMIILTALLSLAALAVAALSLSSAPLQIAADGKLWPAQRRDVFAQVDGTIVEVFVEHGTRVEQGQPLLQMHSTELDVQISELQGVHDRLDQQIAAKEQLLLRNARLDPVTQDQISGELHELKQNLHGTQSRLQLLLEKKQNLTVRSPMRGQVVTWQVDESLLRRPVNRGQVLLSVVDPDGPWELEVYVPERDAGHVLQALGDNQPAQLPATFHLTALPGQKFQGQVVEFQRQTEVQGEHGNSVAVRVALDKTELPQLHNEASVSASIDCGRRARGFVWFRDVVETLRDQWLYWF